MMYAPPGTPEPAVEAPRMPSLVGVGVEPGKAADIVYEYDSTGFATLDAAMNGGFARTTLTLVGGDRGNGKTSLILGCFARTHGHVAYASAEQSEDQVVIHAKRIGATRRGLYVVATKELDDALARFDKLRARFVCIDSLNRFRIKGLNADRGSPKACSAILERCQEWARERKAVVLLISHFTKDGEFAGRSDVQHDVDAMLRIDRGFERERVVHVVKTRSGEDEGRFARFVADARGAFVEAPLVRKPKPVHSEPHDDARRGTVDDPANDAGAGPRRPPQRDRRRGRT